MVGSVRRIVLRRQAYRRAEFFYFAWGARRGVPFDAVDDLRRAL